jgi:hypothetical protein
MSFTSYKKWLNEKFTEDSDPVHDMGIGLRSLIEKWLEKYHIKNYIINDDGTIDAKGDVYFTNNQFETRFKELPEYIKFNKINGKFTIPTTTESCKGFPEYIIGNLGARANNLKSLKYFPKRIDGNCYLNGFTNEEILKVCKVGGQIFNSE